MMLSLENNLRFKKITFLIGWVALNFGAFFVHKYYFDYLYMLILLPEPISKFFFLLTIGLYDITNKMVKLFDIGTKRVIKEYANDKLAITVTCYSESVEEIMNTIDSLTESITYADKKAVLFVIFDGLSKEEGTNKYTWELCMEKMETVTYIEDVNYDTNWKDLPILLNIGFCTYNGIPIVNVIKQTNLGKKDSLSFTRDLLSNRLSYKLTTMIHENMNFLGFSINDIYFCGSMDADCIVNEEGILNLYNAIKCEKYMGVSGMVYPKFEDKKGLWYMYQYAEYYNTQYITRYAMSIMGTATCLPGALNIFDLKNYTDDVRSRFLKYPNKRNMFESLAALIGEDRRFTGLSLYFNKGFKTVVVDNVKIFTSVPNSFRKMKSQRRRWVTSAFINTFYDLCAPELNFIIRFNAFSILLTATFVLYIYVIVITFFMEGGFFTGKHIKYYYIILSLLCSIILYKLHFVTKMKSWRERIYYIIGALLYIVIGPFFLLFILFKSIFEFDNLRWGNIKQNKIVEYEDINKNDIQIKNDNSKSSVYSNCTDVVEIVVLTDDELHNSLR